MHASVYLTAYIFIPSYSNVLQNSNELLVFLPVHISEFNGTVDTFTPTLSLYIYIYNNNVMSLQIIVLLENKTLSCVHP